jgi:hypothetical protein
MSYRYIYSCIFISRVALFFNAVNKPTELVAEVKRREIKVKEIQAEPFRDTERPKAQRGAAQHQGVLPLNEGSGRRSRREEAAGRSGPVVESQVKKSLACGPEQKNTQVPATALAVRLKR